MKPILFNRLLLLVALLVVGNKIFGQGIYVPAATGAWGNSLYTGFGITFPDVYTKNPGLIGGVGIGIGNPVTGLGCQISANVLDPKTQKRFGMGMKIHKYAGKGVFLAIGVENALTKTLGNGSDSPVSQYMSLTQNFKYVLPETAFFSRFSYTIGAGLGRFNTISSRDSLEGKGWKGLSFFSPVKRFGTFAFAAIQFKITPKIHYQVEWSGINLNTGLSFQTKVKNVPFKFMIGVADLTNFSGSGARVISGFTIGFKQKVKKTEKEIEKEELNNDNKQIEKYEELLRVNQIETLAKIDKLIQEELRAILKEELDSIQNAMIAENIKYNQNNSDNQSNLNNQNNQNTKNTQKTDNKNGDKNNNTRNNDEVAKINGNIKPLDKNMKDEKLEKYEQLRVLTDENIIHYSFADTNRSRLSSGIYTIVYSFKTRNYAYRALKSVRISNPQAQVIYNKSRDWYYISIEKTNIENLEEAVKKCDTYKFRGYDGAWLLLYN